MGDQDPSPSSSLSWRVTVGALVVVIFAAAFVIGQTLNSRPSLPVVADGYDCVPASLIPQLDIGQSGTMTTKYAGFTATFSASIPNSGILNGAVAGAGIMPFTGTLTMSGDGKIWVLPHPDTTKNDVINYLCIIAFQRERYPGVMIEGFTGGAHCCEVPVIYDFNQSAGRYVKVVDMSPNHYVDPHAFDHNGGFTPKVAGNQVLLATGDDDFAYAFGCYACSVLPLVLDSVGPNGLVDVTLQHRSLVAAAARSIWKSVQAATVQTGVGPFGLLPAWVADECALGRGATAWSRIEQLQRKGELSNALYRLETYANGSYVDQLKAFLLRNDYCIGQI